MASPRPSKDQKPQPRLYLVTPAVADPSTLKLDLMAALDSADIAAVLLRLPETDDRSRINAIKALAPTVQNFGAALLVEGHPGLVARGGADGAHLASLPAFEQAVGSLKPDRIAGVGGLSTRHDAMIAAERGADYVMFGEPGEGNTRPGSDAILDRVSWWSEVFEVPCVAYAQTIEEVALFAGAGADFVAVGDLVFSDRRGIAAATREIAQALKVSEVAA